MLTYSKRSRVRAPQHVSEENVAQSSRHPVAEVVTLAANALAQKNGFPASLAGPSSRPEHHWRYLGRAQSSFRQRVEPGRGYSRHLHRGRFPDALRVEVPVVYNIKEKLNTSANMSESYSSFFVTRL